MVICKDCSNFLNAIDIMELKHIWAHTSCYVTCGNDPINGGYTRKRSRYCEDLNANLDCQYFIKKKKWWKLR